MLGNKRLFSYCVLLHPTPEEAKEGKSTEVLVPPTEWKLYNNQEEVEAMAIRAIPEEHVQNFGRIEVAVRPF